MTGYFLTTTDGVRLRVTDEGDGRTVVLVSGHASPSEIWTLQQNALLEAGYRVICIDRRYTGLSDFPDRDAEGREVPARDMTMARQGADLDEALTQLDVHDAVLVGSSLGAAACLAMIDGFGTARLAGLVLVDQTPRMISDGDWQFGLYDLTPDTLEEFLVGFGSEAAMSSSRFQRPFGTTPPPQVAEAVAALGLPAYPFPATRDLLRDHSSKDWRGLLGRLDVPALVVAGRHSEVWPAQQADAAERLIPDAECVVFEESGHLPMWTEPEAFNKHLLRFVDHVTSDPDRAETIEKPGDSTMADHR